MDNNFIRVLTPAGEKRKSYKIHTSEGACTLFLFQKRQDDRNSI